MTDSDPDIRWMTYAEAARVLAVNPESVAKRMRRGNWARRLGNDGKPRVGVPVSVLPSVPVTTYVVPPPVPDNAPMDVPVIVPDNAASSMPSVPDMKRPQSAQPDAIDPVQVLASRLEAEAERANRLEAELLGATSRAAAAEGEATTLRDALGYARAQAATERAARDRAQKDLMVQEAEAAALQTRLEGAQKTAEVAAKLDEAVRRELEVLKTERDTIQRLGFLGRLAWAVRGNRT